MLAHVAEVAAGDSALGAARLELGRLAHPVTQPNQKAWISITKPQPIRWISAQIMMRPLATVNMLAHRHASSDGITQRSYGKATKWRFQSTFEAPVWRGNDFSRV